VWDLKETLSSSEVLPDVVSPSHTHVGLWVRS
jgi:hypothetical protein